ncbi:hypothetical protein V5799_020802 [Amblyomma americanum]|uniref:Uncharacterized protein n=1 Tax=Amblyomma americanum TaxID=6943 RepID=A0AAQ4ET16_AMBAM
MSLSAQLVTYKRLLEEEYGVDCRVRDSGALSRRFSAGSDSGDYSYDDSRKREQKSQRNSHHERPQPASGRKADSYEYDDGPRRRGGVRKAAPSRPGAYKGREDYDYYNDQAKAMPTPPLPPPNVEYEDEDAKEYYDFKPDVKRGDQSGDGGRGTRGRLRRGPEDDERPSRKSKRADGRSKGGRKNEAPQEKAAKDHAYADDDDESPVRPGSSYDYGFEEGFSKKKLKRNDRNEDASFFEDDQDSEQEDRRRNRRQDAPALGNVPDDDDETLDEERMNAGLDAEKNIRGSRRARVDDEDDDEDPFFRGKLARAKQDRKFQRSRYMQMEDDGYEEAQRRKNLSGELLH